MMRWSAWVLVALASLEFAAPAHAFRCRTLERRRQVVQSRLAVLWFQSDRPASAATLGSARGFPFLVHGPQGSTALLARVRDAMDRAWQAEIVDGGWPAPPPDRGGPDSAFDVYLDSSLSSEEAYVEGEDDVPETAWDDATSFMVLSLDLPADAVLYSVVAHELNHASQFAIDALESDAFFEHTAVLVEQRVAHDVPTYGLGIPDFQAHPGRALDYLDPNDSNDLYEYGAAMWLMFLTEHLGDGTDALVRRLWLGSRQSAPDQATNEPDFLDALDPILAEKGWSRARFFATFAAWRYFTGPRDDGRHFADGAQWGVESLIGVERRALGTAPVEIATSLAAFGAHLGVLDLPPGSRALEVRLGGDSPAAALWFPGSAGAAAVDPATVVGSAPERVGVPEGASQLFLALTYAPPDYQPNGRDWAGRRVSVSVALASDSADGGPPVSPPTPVSGAGGSGCGAREPVGAPWAASLLVAGALVMLVTRRRMRR